MAKAEGIYEMSKPPEGLEGCEDCARMEELARLIGLG